MYVRFTVEIIIVRLDFAERFLQDRRLIQSTVHVRAFGNECRRNCTLESLYYLVVDGDPRNCIPLSCSRDSGFHKFFIRRHYRNGFYQIKTIT